MSKSPFVHYVLAGYPLLWVETHEEQRALQQFVTSVLTCGHEYECFSWDRVSGLSKHIIEDNKYKTARVDSESLDLNDPYIILEWFGQQKNNNMVLFLKDYHNYIKKDPVPRKIRNLLQFLKGSSKNLVIVSPVMEIPVELEKDTTVVPFSLPGRDELKVVLKGICESANLPYPKQDEELIDNALGMTSVEAENAYSISFSEKKTFDPAVIRREKTAIIRRTGMLEVLDANVNLDEVGGLENLKSWFLARQGCFSQDAKKFGITPPKGALLIGVPGCGKSLTCKAVGSAWHRPVLRLDTGKLFGEFVGQSESNVRKVIAICEAVAPVVLFIDELEKSMAGAGGKGDYGNQGHETTKRVFSTLLSWLSDKTADVFILATANNVNAIPPEFLRSGRFDRMFWVDMPTDKQREEILSIHLAKVGRKVEPFKKDMPKLVEASKGFSGADIEVWVKEALVSAYNPKGDLTSKHLLGAVKEVTPIASLMKGSIEESREWAKSHGAKPASLEEVAVAEEVGTRKLKS